MIFCVHRLKTAVLENGKNKRIKKLCLVGEKRGYNKEKEKKMKNSKSIKEIIGAIIGGLVFVLYFDFCC